MMLTMERGGAIVADISIFPEGKAAVCWRGAVKSVAVYDSFADAQKVHGHSGTSFHIVGARVGHGVHVFADNADQGRGVVVETDPSSSHPVCVLLDSKHPPQAIWFMMGEVTQ